MASSIAVWHKAYLNGGEQSVTINPVADSQAAEL